MKYYLLFVVQFKSEEITHLTLSGLPTTAFKFIVTVAV
jgi:hypothetical protein